ncbi:MAG: OmpA family protein [Culturomica sp.]|jgi:outer membrane protein OmpA-like peptidoglycan-associated protein|nr:OmpA family protein [Culturomica sp.]
MKKTFVMLLIASTPLLSFAQNEVSVTEKGAAWSEYETNRFWDNWFISLGAGAQVYFGKADVKQDFGKRITPAFDLSVGKWIVPTLGLRIQGSGFREKAVAGDRHAYYLTGGKTKKGFLKQSWKQYNIHGDVLINLSNWIGGYRSDRFYELVPYLGFGWMHACQKKGTTVLMAGAGLIHKMRISQTIDFNIEMRGMVFDKKFAGEGGAHPNAIGTLTGGFTFNLQKADFNRSSAALVMAEDIELAAANQRLTKAEGELADERARNSRLENELTRERAKKPKVIVESAPLAIFFNINKTNVTAKEKVNLRYAADVIKKNTNKTYTIEGYADSATGTPEYNMELSRKRAQHVYDILTKEFGVNPNQLKIQAKGGVSDLFDSNPLNRVTIIE